MVSHPLGRSTRAISRKLFGAKTLTRRSTAASCAGHAAQRSATAKTLRRCIGNCPAERKLLQVAGFSVQHICTTLGSMWPTVEVIETHFEATDRMPPYATKRVILADDQQAVCFKDAGGFPVVPT